MFDSLAKKAKREVVRLPDEITYEILVRLPVDSLLKCRVVCKWWNSMIKSSTFILTHLKSTLLIQSNNNKNNKKDNLLLIHAQHKKEDPSGSEFFMLDCDDINDEYTKRRVIPTSDIKAVSPIYEGREINVDQQNFYPVGTCNGLICLVCLDTEKRISMPIIWNPCVRKFLVLPSPSFSPYEVAFFLYELGYDSHNNDIKLVQIVVPKFQDDQTPCTFQVFSLLRGSWKDLNAPADFKPFLNDLTAVEVSGALHWICGKPFTEINESTVIVTFNLSSELFGKMKIPEALKKDSTGKCCYKLRYRESFALLFQRSRTENNLTDLWVMKEYGVAESWTKLLTIHMPDSLGRLRIYFRNSGQVVIGTFLQGLQSLDPKSKQVKNIVDDRLTIPFMHPFFESLVLLDRSDAFSY